MLLAAERHALAEADMTVTGLDGTVIDGDLAPTSEVPMHLSRRSTSMADTDEVIDDALARFYFVFAQVEQT